MKRILGMLWLLLCLPPPAPAQIITAFPYREGFDTSRIPLLPAGWTTSKAKSPAGDFTTTQSTPYSPPASVLSTDARVAQQLIAPGMSLSAQKALTLEFYERRSSTFNAGLIVEAALGDDTLHWRPISDTLLLVSSSAYIRRVITLSGALDDQPLVRLRWRTLGNGTGATGTLRIDDVTLTVERRVDLALDSTVGVPGQAIEAGADASCLVVIRNCAREGAYAWSLAVYDSAVDAPVAQRAGTTLFKADDTLSVALVYPSIPPGVHQMRCRLACPGDEDTSNNEARFRLTASHVPQSVVVNEIMYEPLEGQAEYLELFNRSGQVIDCQGWSVADGPPSKKNRTIVPLSPLLPHTLAPGEYCVVADDSAVVDLMERAAPGHACDAIIRPSLSLNNSGDEVLLLDASGTVIDQVSYSPAWHLVKGSNAGRSLERINPGLAGTDARNWSTSIAHSGGTPGSKNSIYTLSVPADASLELSPNPFSPDGDGMDDFLSIAYALQSNAMTLRVRIFDSAGRLVRTLANNEPAAARGTIIWNGRDDHDTRVRMGVYIVFLEALDLQGAVFRTLKGAAVVAMRLD